MEDPRPPTDAQPPVPDAGPPESLEALAPERRRRPVFAAPGLAIAAAGILASRSLTAGEPRRRRAARGGAAGAPREHFGVNLPEPVRG